MVDKQGDTGSQEQDTGKEIDVRKTAEFRGLASEAARHKAEAAELQKQVAELLKFKESVDASKNAEEQKRLAEQGEYNKALEIERQNAVALQKQLDALNRKTLEYQAENVLRGLGLNDPLRLRGAVSMLPHDATETALQSWAEGLREQSPDAFKAGATGPSRASGVTLNGGVNSPEEGGTNWKSIKAATQINPRTREQQKQQREALDVLQEYVKSHNGQLPSGWENL